MGGHFADGGVIGEDGGDLARFAEVGDIDGGEAPGGDVVFEGFGEDLGDDAVDFPRGEVDALGEGPLGFFDDEPIGVGAAEGRDPADDAAAIGPHGVNSKAYFFGLDHAELVVLISDMQRVVVSYSGGKGMRAFGE